MELKADVNGNSNSTNSSIGSSTGSSTDIDHDPVRCRDHIAQLHDALGRARRIGAAIGIIMATLRLTEDQAFAFLDDASQRFNRKLRELADSIVLTGELPPARDGSGG